MGMQNLLKVNNDHPPARMAFIMKEHELKLGIVELLFSLLLIECLHS